MWNRDSASTAPANLLTAATETVSISRKDTTPAIFLHGFRRWHNYGRPTARLSRVDTSTWDFHRLPTLYQNSFVLEYATDVPFNDAVESVRSALRTAGININDVVIHAHSMGGLIAAALLKDPGSTPVAAFFYDSPFGGLNSSLASWLRSALTVEPLPTTAAGLAWAFARRPLMTALQLWAPHYLDRAHLSAGQLAFLAPILGEQPEVLRALRQSVIDLRARNGGHAYVVRWEHPAELPHAPASEDPRVAAAMGGMRPWLKAVLRTVLPRYWFNITGSSHAGWEEWAWHSPHPPGEWRGTFIDHISRHGGGQMFQSPTASNGSGGMSKATVSVDEGAASAEPDQDASYVDQVFRLSLLATKQRRSKELHVDERGGASAASV